MSQQTHASVAAGIVLRLRSVFLVISAVTILGMIAGLKQLQSVSNSIEELTVSSVSVFVNAEENERGLKELLFLLLRVEKLEEGDELFELERDTIVEITHLRSTMLDFPSPVDEQEAATHAEMTRSTNLALDEVESHARNILFEKKAVLDLDTELAKQESILEDAQRNLSNRLEDLTHVVAIENLRVSDEEAASLDQMRARYRQSLLYTNALTKIAADLDVVADSGAGVRKLTERAELQAAESALRFRLRGISNLLVQLPDIPERTELARDIVSIWKLILDPKGLIETAKQLQIHTERLGAHVSEVYVPLGQISAHSTELVASARARVEVARVDLAQKSARMSVISKLTGVLSLITIAATSLFVVENQISKRMAKLTKAVEAIASGNLEYKVDVEGADEIGEIASALEVFRLNAEALERSNIELEKFAYVAAHDLRSPLRAIQDLAEWTLEDPDCVFSEDGHENMSLLQQRIQRMNQLLTDLLEYARAGTESDKMASVNTKALFNDTVAMLAPSADFDIHYNGPDVDIVTYVTPLRQILLNLASNSIKHRDVAMQRIDIDIELGEERMQLRVTDDGLGIDGKYHQKIFELFQTLRSRDEVEGSGMGLAITHKILEHYDCSIYVISSPDVKRGASFCFDFPYKLANKV